MTGGRPPFRDRGSRPGGGAARRTARSRGGGYSLQEVATDQNPDGFCEGERLSVAEERRSGEEATALPAERPPDDDALVSGRRRLQDMSREASEHAHPAGEARVDGEGAGAVERSPDELGRQWADAGELRGRAPRRGDAAVPRRRRAEPQRVALDAAGTAGEAARERMVRFVGPARCEAHGIGVRHRRRQLEVELRGTRLRDETIALEDLHAV